MPTARKSNLQKSRKKSCSTIMWRRRIGCWGVSWGVGVLARWTVGPERFGGLWGLVFGDWSLGISLWSLGIGLWELVFSLWVLVFGYLESRRIRESLRIPNFSARGVQFLDEIAMVYLPSGKYTIAIPYNFKTLISTLRFSFSWASFCGVGYFIRELP